jgi:hypothetical protein
MPPENLTWSAWCHMLEMIFLKGRILSHLRTVRKGPSTGAAILQAKESMGPPEKSQSKYLKKFQKDKLQAYDFNRYDTPYWSLCKVHPDHHISFRKSLYSVPTTYIGKQVEVRGDSALVRIYYRDRLIKTHKRLEEGKRCHRF